MEPRFNNVPRDWGNLFVKLRVRYIENLDLKNRSEKYELIISPYSCHFSALARALTWPEPLAVTPPIV